MPKSAPCTGETSLFVHYNGTKLSMHQRPLMPLISVLLRMLLMYAKLKIELNESI